MLFEKTETFYNLARSFAGECQAGMRYQLIAKTAMTEPKIIPNMPPTPLTVPPVPIAEMKISTVPSVSFHISGPVVL